MKIVFKKHWLFILLSIAYFLFSFLTYKDYGVTFDEKVEYDAGEFLISYLKTQTTSSYITKLLVDGPNNIETRHLPPFSVYSRIYPALLSLFNPHNYFEWFHLGNLLFGYFLFLFSYTLFFLHYRSSLKSIVAPLLIILSPLILGHIPANPKDIPFATLYLLGILGIYFFQSRKISTNIEILTLGFIFGVVQSQRLVGLTLLIGYFILGILNIEKRNLGKFFDLVVKTSLVFLVSVVFWVICLPFLGLNLPANIWALILNASSYSDWNHEIIYFGKYLLKDQRPWHYLFVYLALKLSLSVLVAILLGAFLMITRKIKYNKSHPIFLISLLVTLNILLYLSIHPVIYNGIRHFLYLVVCLVLISGFFLVDIFSRLNSIGRRILVITFGLYSLLTITRSVHLHPYEYIFYNELAGGLKGVHGKFDAEYWGASYKEAAEFVRKRVIDLKLDNISVYACDNQYSVVYYSQFEYSVIGSSSTANIILCDLHKDGMNPKYATSHSVLRTINREGVPIFNIRCSEEFSKVCQ